MTLDQERVQELFNAAMKLASAEREPFLDKECGDDDAELRKEIESLLQCTPTSSQTIEPATIAPAPGEVVDHRYEQGDRIGNYEIISELGEGGFGVVYFAKQHEPVERKVAIKVLHSKRCTKSFILGFEAERQTLANMNHPGIAHFYDAGLTPHNQPFFVMEFVSGQPITDYCDAHRLTIVQRLSLFVDVCKAVQHAHNKGVIHRDLTPNNILVSAGSKWLKGEGGTHRAQIIDFGIARKTDEETADVTGTLVYMSPEQATKDASVDTRSDIYTLGVVLYELLVGKPPLDAEMFKGAALQAKLKLVQEQDPPTPSTKLSGIQDSDETAGIAEQRQENLVSLLKLLRRELGWIPIKALRKLPRDRYEHPSDLGDDISRYLNGEILEAAPDSTAYRVKKTFKRNKGKLIAAATILFVLVGGITFSLYFAFDAEQQREDAVAERETAIEQTRIANEEWSRAEAESIRAKEQSAIALQEKSRAEAESIRANKQATIALQEKMRAEAVTNFVRGMLSVDGNEVAAMDNELMMLVLSKATESVGEKFEDQPLVEWEIREIIAQTYSNFGKYDEAEQHYFENLAISRRVWGDENTRTVLALKNVGYLLLLQSKPFDAEQYFAEALLGASYLDAVDKISLNENIGLMYWRQGKFEKAEAILVGILEEKIKYLGRSHPMTLESMFNLNLLYIESGKYEKAEPVLVEILEVMRRSPGNNHPNTLAVIDQMGTMFLLQNKINKAEPYIIEALEGRLKILGRSHPQTQQTLMIYSNILILQGEHEKALEILKYELEIARVELGEAHQQTLNLSYTIARCYHQQGKLDEAEQILRDALNIARDNFGNEHHITLNFILMSGMTLYNQNKYEDAQRYMLEAYETNLQEYGENDFSHRCLNGLASCYDKWGKPEEAQKYRDMLPEG